MKNVKMGTRDIVVAYNVLKTAKYQSLEDSDKIKIWKISRLMRPIANKYDEDVSDAQQKLIPSQEFNENLEKAQEFEIIKRDNLDKTPPMTEDEYNDFLVEFKKYRNLVENALRELAEKEVEIEIETLSEESFEKLMSSNNWTIKQVENIDFIID